MKATLETITTVKQAVTVEVTADQVAKSRRTILTQIGRELRIGGFRPGKAPLELVERQLGAKAAKEIIQQVVRDTYPTALREVGARPIADPAVQAREMKPNAAFSYRAVFEIYPEVTVERNNGWKLEREEVVVSDDEIDAELERLRQRLTQLEPAPDGTITAGTVAMIDFRGTADGQPFKGSETKNFVVDFGHGNLLGAFEEQIQGMKTGEQRRITFTYPTDYFNKEVAGKRGEFDVSVKEVRRKIVPSLDDEFAKSFGNFSTFAALRQEIHHRIAAAKEDWWRRRLHRQVMEQIAAAQPIDLPEAMVSAELSSMLEAFSRELAQRGQTLEEAKVDVPTFIRTNMEEAKLRVRGFLLVHAVSRDQKMEVGDDEVEARIAHAAAQSGEPKPQLKARLEKNNALPRLKTELLMEKALDFMVGRSKIKVVKPKNVKKE